MMRKYSAILLTVFLLAVLFPAMAETVTPLPAPTADSYANVAPEALLQQWYQIGSLLRANGNYPFTELQKGDQGYEVIALQTRLSELGYYQKKVVDNFGSGTFSALKAFEKANALKADGKASVEDQKALFASDAVAATDAKTTAGDTGNTGKEQVDATSGATSQ
ncbi:MAG: peptidoglycan-binding domain-containing protein [Candidatus Limiplasma sp.]|nr:peptidoglycan-binding domain-containing protein [Candidatus Limiplasma sp.]